MKKVLFFLLTTSIIFYSSDVFSQLSEISFNSRVNQSSTIIEGKVINKASFWDTEQHNIYTVNTIKVFKVFKGHLTSSTVEVITLGGTIGFTKEIVQPSLSLRANDIGIFMLKNSTIHLQGITQRLRFEPYSDMQGFIKYDINNNTAAGPFDSFTDIESSLYIDIQNLTNSKYSIIAPYKVKQRSTNKKSASFSFTPTTVTAGTATTITITGTGFGASPGTVRFSNADNGGATYVDGLASEIISWSPTQIVVEVNSDAGTGTIQVVGSGTTTSSQTLTVTYSQLNAFFNSQSYQTRHINKNGNGGYIWQMNTDFDASPANIPFVRALDSWRCNTGINWTIGTTTTVDVIANDNVNVIRHDNGGELPPGVLGRCTSRWNGCPGVTIEWYVNELDIVFDDGTNWNYTANAPSLFQFDFESVAAHELGHGHQLAHVINTNDIMHFSLSNGEQNRTPSANSIAGANDVQSRSTGGAVCNQTVMTDYICSSSLPVELLSFDAIRNNPDEVQLNWTTDSETNNKGFFIERMQENEAIFKPIAWVEGNGTTIKENYYQFIDPNGYTSTSYYRLQQVDFDGTVSYSEIRTALGNQNLTNTNVVIFPNTVKNVLKIRFPELTEGVQSATIGILNASGQLLHQFNSPVQAYQVLEIDFISKLPAAMYFLSVDLDNGQKIVQKFVKE